MKTKRFVMSTVLISFVLLFLVACSGLELPIALSEPLSTLAVSTQPALPAASDPAAQASLNGTLGEIYRQVNPSVVHIQVTQLPGGNNVNTPDIPNIPGFPGLPDAPQSNTPLHGEGSGFVWDKDGHIITNNHVVDNAEKITVIFADGGMADASVVGTDPDGDLAVLKVDVPAEQLQPVTLADSTALQVGDLAIAIGNPFGQEGTMTTGIVSALGRLLPVETTDLNAPRYNIPDVIQTDAAINPGNSGGVLLNGRGEVIGVTSAIISAARSSSGIGFAIPSTIVQQIVPALIANGHYDHPYIGISGTSLTPQLAQTMDLPTDQRGALVVEVMPDSPAGQAGLLGSDTQAEIDGEQVPIGGDVIIAVDGQTLQGMDDLISYLYRYGQVGQKINLTILRDGNEQTLEITLQARPQTENQPSSPTNAEQQGSSTHAWMGISGLTVTGDLAIAMDLDQNQGGVLIQQVEPGSAADNAGLHGSFEPSTVNGENVMLGGDIIITANGESIQTIQDLQSIVNQAEPGDQLQLTILRDGQELEVPLTLGEQSN